MIKSLSFHSKLLVSRIVNFALILAIVFLAGCASRRLVPLPDGGMINPELRSAMKTDNGVTVRVQASAWYWTPSDLDSYVTSLYVVIENDTSSTLTFDYPDFVLFDENRTQYNALTPETVANILQAAYRSTYIYPPFYFSGSVFIGSGFFYFSPYYLYPFYPWWDYPAYYQVPLDDVFNKALMAGRVNPNARVQGFIYFTTIPSNIKNVTLEIGYKFEGEPEPYQLSFPFAIEKSRK
ncbi:MAG: hypothetical protein ACREOW_04660 [Thermodesulfobacteriota bacterium]